MLIAISQINSTLGDFSGNRRHILQSVQWAKQQKCELVIFPEACLFGYHPVDLLERDSIVVTQLSQFNILTNNIPDGIFALIGIIARNPNKKGKPYLNAAALACRKKILRVFSKQLLPTYDVFDESRHIETGDMSQNYFNIRGVRFLVSICEDMWGWTMPGQRTKYLTNPFAELEKKSCDLIINMSASPYTADKRLQRHFMAAKTAKHLKAPMVYVNMVGAQDELIFDGGSFLTNSNGQKILQCEYFQEDHRVFSLPLVRPEKAYPLPCSRIRPKEATSKNYQALTMGIREFVSKTGFKSVHLGSSGGIDSAVVACLAAKALGPERVHCIGIPGPFSSKESLIWAEQLARNLKTHWLTISVTEIYERIFASLDQNWGVDQFGLAHENIQARLRALFLMAFSNLNNSLLLSSSNKSELAVGYATLYGDMCGGLAPIGDLLKTEVYKIAEHMNALQPTLNIIPLEIIHRAPSAELRPDQKDSDTLPSYEKLDKAVQHLVQFGGAARSKLEKNVLTWLMKSEFKRWQAPPILRISSHAFGRGRRFPIAHRALY